MWMVCVGVSLLSFILYVAYSWSIWYTWYIDSEGDEIESKTILEMIREDEKEAELIKIQKSRLQRDIDYEKYNQQCDKLRWQFSWEIAVVIRRLYLFVFYPIRRFTGSYQFVIVGSPQTVNAEPTGPNSQTIYPNNFHKPLTTPATVISHISEVL
jgi:hypothetical protein